MQLLRRNKTKPKIYYIHFALLNMLLCLILLSAEIVCFSQASTLWCSIVDVGCTDTALHTILSPKSCPKYHVYQYLQVMSRGSRAYKLLSQKAAKQLSLLVKEDFVSEHKPLHAVTVASTVTIHGNNCCCQLGQPTNRQLSLDVLINITHD